MTTDNPDPLEVWREACGKYEDACEAGDTLRDGVILGDQAAAAIIAQHYAPLEAENARLRNTCEAPEVAAMRYIEALRSNYGSVTILPDNEEADTRAQQTAIDCCGEWTNWQDQRFYGETVLQCLARAVGILNKWKDMNNVG